MKKGYIPDHSVDSFSQQSARSESANASLLQFSELRRKGEGRSKKKGKERAVTSLHFVLMAALGAFSIESLVVLP